MICTISSRGSPLPPGHWCDAFSVTSAAPAVPATAKPTTTAVVEKSTRIFIDITEFLPVACYSVDTRCPGVASCSAKRRHLQPEIGRAQCREKVCPTVLRLGGSGQLKKNK